MKKYKITIIAFILLLCAIAVLTGIITDYKYSELLGAEVTFEHETTGFKYNGYDYIKLPDNYSFKMNTAEIPLTMLKQGSTLISALEYVWIYSSTHDVNPYYLACYHHDFIFEGGLFYREDLGIPALTKENILSIEFYSYEDEKLIMTVDDKKMIEKILSMDANEVMEVFDFENISVEYCAVLPYDLCYWFY